MARIKFSWPLERITRFPSRTRREPHLLPIKIVTVFLEYKGKYVIMHRADTMPTYPKKWSAISGHIEEGEDVITAGLRELSEETGISKGNVEVMKTSKHILVPAPEYLKLWVINPVLVRLKKEQKIRLDSENVEFRWVTPEEMKNYDLVPSVYEALMLLAKAPGEFPLINKESM